jgi:hypothetical protein
MDSDEEDGDRKLVKRATSITDIDLTPQKHADSDNSQDFAELGRHAEGMIEVNI